jgi:hypothetical protein
MLDDGELADDLLDVLMLAEALDELLDDAELADWLDAEDADVCEDDELDVSLLIPATSRRATRKWQKYTVSAASVNA